MVFDKGLSTQNLSVFRNTSNHFLLLTTAHHSYVYIRATFMIFIFVVVRSFSITHGFGVRILAGPT